MVVSYNAATGELTLQGVAPVAEYQALLRTVTYRNPLDEPNPTPRQVVFLVTDGHAESEARVATVNMVMLNDPPRLDLDSAVANATGFATVYTEGMAGVALAAPTVRLEDDDDSQLYSATFTLLYAPDGSYEQLYVPAAFPGNVTGNNTHTLHLQHTANLTEWLDLLQLVQYFNGDDWPDMFTERWVEVYVTDATVPRERSNVANVSVTVVPVNDAPQLAFNGTFGDTASVSFRESGSPVALTTPDFWLFDPDDEYLVAATITITNLQDRTVFDNFELLVVNASGTDLVSDYTSLGVLSITGNATVEEYRQVLATLTYENVHPSPTRGDRVITGTVSDGRLVSSAAVVLVTVEPLNNAPAADLNGFLAEGVNYTTIFVQQLDPVRINSDIMILEDYEGDLVTSATLQLDPVLDVGDELLIVAHQPPAVVPPAGAVSGAINAPITGVCTEPADPRALCTYSTFTITDAGTVADVYMSLSVAHPNIGDLVVSLKSTSANRKITLFSNLADASGASGRCGQDNLADVVLTDDAPRGLWQLQCSQGDVTGSFRPDTPFFTAFVGQQAAGQWQLEVRDTFASRDFGFLQQWSLNLVLGDRTQGTMATATPFTAATQHKSIISIDSTQAVTDVVVELHMSFAATPVTGSVYLRSPDNTQVELTTGTACTLSSISGVVFSDDGAAQPGGCPPSSTLRGLLHPMYSASLRTAFNDKVAFGDWTLVWTYSQPGTLQGWSLHLSLRPNIQWTYDATAGLLQLTGADRDYTYQEVLATLYYNNTHPVPNDTQMRTISYVFTDAQNTSEPVNAYLYVHNWPILDLDVTTAGQDAAAYFTEKAGSVRLFDANITTSDDFFLLTSMRVEMTNVLDPGFEVFTWNDTAAVTGAMVGSALVFTGGAARPSTFKRSTACGTTTWTATQSARTGSSGSR